MNTIAKFVDVAYINAHELRVGNSIHINKYKGVYIKH